MMGSLECAKARIRAILSRSSVPEDSRHAENVLEWVLRLDPDADEALQIAALAHDIERAVGERKVRRADVADYDAFKAAHAANSAAVLREVLGEAQVEPTIGEEACRLVEAHEAGGDPRSDLLKDADSLSFFEINLPLYLAREGHDEALRRCLWGYGRLSARGRELLRTWPAATSADVTAREARKLLCEVSDEVCEPRGLSRCVPPRRPR